MTTPALSAIKAWLESDSSSETESGDLLSEHGAEILRALEAVQWQPIETAPKDGTYIIAWCVHDQAKYCENAIKEGYACPVIASWVDHNGGGWMWHGLAGVFTHWMPLPAAPESDV